MQSTAVYMVQPDDNSLSVATWESGTAVHELEDEGTFTFTLEAFEEFDGTNLGSKLSPPVELFFRQKIYFQVILVQINFLLLYC